MDSWVWREQCGSDAMGLALITSPRGAPQGVYEGGKGGGVWGVQYPHPPPRHLACTTLKTNFRRTNLVGREGQWGRIAGGVGVGPWPLSHTGQVTHQRPGAPGGGGAGRAGSGSSGTRVGRKSAFGAMVGTGAVPGCQGSCPRVSSAKNQGGVQERVPTQVTPRGRPGKSPKHAQRYTTGYGGNSRLCRGHGQGKVGAGPEGLAVEMAQFCARGGSRRWGWPGVKRVATATTPVVQGCSRPA